MPKVMTICPVRGDVVWTDAVMTDKEFGRLTSDLAIYCRGCRAPHLIARDRLWLEGGAGDPSGPSRR